MAVERGKGEGREEGGRGVSPLPKLFSAYALDLGSVNTPF